MSNVLILSENTVFKEDLSAQISYHIPDFEIVEDKSLADIIIIDENISFLSDISDTSNAPVIFIGKENISDSTKIHMFVQKPVLLGKFIDDIKASINIYENSTEGNIEFKNVNFRYYKKNKELVLDNINLKIGAGSTVGIIGSTGSGKSTLISMIPRLYDVDSGSVLVDGVDVKDYSLKNLRDGIGIVLQKNLLFSGTIMHNLLWGDENASYDEVVRASQNSAADKFVSSFTDGYETMLDKGGSNLSGGQKQRLCIARALVKKPKILILDDSTSAVDTATEAQIRTSFKNDLPECTKIIIAQLISSVNSADEIIVMNDGKITGIGTHDYLLENNEEYSEIYYSQMDKKEA